MDMLSCLFFFFFFFPFFLLHLHLFGVLDSGQGSPPKVAGMVSI